MATVEGDIETLSRAILGEARVETEGLRTEARAKADAIRQRAQAQADRERKEILDLAAQEADRLRGQAVATAQLKARSMELEHREKLLNQVFEAAAGQLRSVPQRQDYQAIAVRLLREALTQLRADKAEILADPLTQKVLSKSVVDGLSKDLHVQLVFGETLEHSTGVVVQAADGHLTFDNTLETRLARLQGALRSAVYHVMMGDTP